MSALAAFVAVEKRTVDRVICNLLLNYVNKEQPLEVIDNLSLKFNDGTDLTIGLNLEASGLDVIKFDRQEAESQFPPEFAGKIKMVEVDASTTSMWKDVIGLQLVHVKLSKEGDNYKNDALVLDFGEEKREITLGSLDGLVIDYFEE
jgi:hypothetical protein